MSTETKTFTAPLHFTVPKFFSTKPKLSTWALTFVVMLSGFGVVYMSDTNRRMTTELENAHAHNNYLETQWDKLLLERSTWSSQSRIQTLARTSFGMVAPDPTTVKTIRLRS